MFLFENLIDIDNRSIQRILQEVESDSLVVALKGGDQAARSLPPQLCRNVLLRLCVMTCSFRGPVRMSQVEAEQKAILLVVRRLAETGGSCASWRRRYLCLIICRGKPGRRTISRHHRQSLCP
ncbi:FliG C-terminal domain-containing protein [Escherichia coli]